MFIKSTISNSPLFEGFNIDEYLPFTDSVPPPTPKPTTTLPKGGKADKDEDESDGAAALSLSLLAGVALFAA